MTGLYILVGCALSYIAGGLTMAGILARHVVHEDRREQHAENVRQSRVAADWRPATLDISTWDTVQLPVIPAQRTGEAVAA